MVTEQFLLEGAVYALENSGSLLRDAVAMYERGSYATAIVMAMFGREEFGKYRILRGELEKVAAGGTVTAKLLSKKGKGPIFDHPKKLEQAVGSIVQRADRDSPLGKLLIAARMKFPIGSPERIKADQELAKITEAKRKALPALRHNLRMERLYVGLDQTQTRWVRPNETTAMDALHEVSDAVCDYNRALENVTIFPSESDSVFLKAFYAWKDRPQLTMVDLPK
jgi:AbiV family abortive infection protein